MLRSFLCSLSWVTITVMRSTIELSVTMMEETAANPLSRPRRLVASLYLRINLTLHTKRWCWIWCWSHWSTLCLCLCLFPCYGVTHSLGTNSNSHALSGFLFSVSNPLRIIYFLASKQPLEVASCDYQALTYKWSFLSPQGYFIGNYNWIYSWRPLYFTLWTIFKEILCFLSNLKLLEDRWLIPYPREWELSHFINSLCFSMEFIFLVCQTCTLISLCLCLWN